MKVIIRSISRLLIILLFIAIKSTNTKVSCPTCRTIPYGNMTSDITQHMHDCTMQKSDQCNGELFVSYTSKEQWINSVFLSNSENLLNIHEPEDFVYEAFLISLKKFYINRGIRIYCSQSSNCSLHQLQLFRETISTFVPMPLWKALSDLLYNSTAVPADLVCLNSSNKLVACPNGVCRVSISGKTHQIDPTCFQTQSSRRPLALDWSQSSSLDRTLTFTCNKPLCNSKERAQQVLKILTSTSSNSK